jgi:hypothetical protein
METLFLVSGIMVFLSGCLSAGFASSIPYRLIDEINERSPEDQQIGTFPRISEVVWRRHRELFPGSPKRRQMNVAAVAGVVMMFAGICLLLDYSSLHDINRSRDVAPRQQAIAGTLTAGPVGRNSYSYTFIVASVSYNDWGSVYGSEPKIGQEVLVYYDPRDPTVNALARFEYSSRRRAWDIGLGLFAILFVAVGILVSLLIARVHL